MDVLDMIAMLKTLKWKFVQSMARLKISKLKWLTRFLSLFLSIGMPYYQQGCNISLMTKLKVLIENLCEK